jgi:hypothetical protein
VSWDEDQQRYRAAAHAMQTGVATKMAVDPSETTPKHLRVGVNSAMVENAALVKLLIAKGIVTEAEWFSALADQMEAEKALYEKYLSVHFGNNIRLG